MNIKKFFIITSLLATSSFIFAQNLPFVTFSLGLSTGHIFYGNGTFEIPSSDDDTPSTPEPSDPVPSTPEETTPDVPDTPDPEETPDLPETPVDPENSYSPLYNENTIPLRLEDGNEVLIGFSAALSLNFTNNFSLFTDADVMADFNWQDKNYSHHLDYSFSTGVKLSFFDAIPGLTASIGYLLGDRIDFYKTEGSDLYVNKTPWGNGLKLAVEYSFYRDTGTRFLPTLGCSWRYIPRGNNSSDNIIQSYVLVNF